MLSQATEVPKIGRIPHRTARDTNEERARAAHVVAERDSVIRLNSCMVLTLPVDPEFGQKQFKPLAFWVSSRVPDHGQFPTTGSLVRPLCVSKPRRRDELPNF